MDDRLQTMNDGRRSIVHGPWSALRLTLSLNTTLRHLQAAIVRLSQALPPLPNLVLLGAMNGHWYGDNSRHVFEWLLEHRPDLQAIWVTQSPAVYRSLTEANKPAVLAWSWRGLSYLRRARVALFTNSLNDIAADPELVPNSLPLIALRHGRSVKRVRFARTGHALSPAEARQRRREGKLIRYAASTSEFMSDLQEECLQIGRHKHVVTGYPRNDNLLAVTSDQRAEWQTFLAGIRPRKVVLYGPSWRHGREPTRFFPFADFDAEALASTLRTQQMLLLLRPHVQDLQHPSVRGLCDHLTAHGDCIRLASHEQLPDVNRFLPFVDVLISDYSALYHDFLLLDRPLLFIPYDYEAFARQNGFLYDYFQNLPGPAIAAWTTFLDHLNRCAEGRDDYQQQRRALRDRVHEVQDARSCERVIALVDRILHDE